jgi:hypothetical protein
MVTAKQDKSVTSGVVKVAEEVSDDQWLVCEEWILLVVCGEKLVADVLWTQQAADFKMFLWHRAAR